MLQPVLPLRPGDAGHSDRDSTRGTAETGTATGKANDSELLTQGEVERGGNQKSLNSHTQRAIVKKILLAQQPRTQGKTRLGKRQRADEGEK